MSIENKSFDPGPPILLVFLFLFTIVVSVIIGTRIGVDIGIERAERAAVISGVGYYTNNVDGYSVFKFVDIPATNKTNRR